VKALTVESNEAILQAVWIHVLKELLDVPDDDNPIAASLVNQNGITSFNNLLVLSLNEIDTLSSIPVGLKGRIRSIISLYNDWTCMFGSPIDMRTVTDEDFANYRSSSYSLEQPLGFFQQQRELQFPVVISHRIFGSTPNNDTSSTSMSNESQPTSAPTIAPKAIAMSPNNSVVMMPAILLEHNQSNCYSSDKQRDYLPLPVSTAHMSRPTIESSDYLPMMVSTVHTNCSSLHLPENSSCPSNANAVQRDQTPVHPTLNRVPPSPTTLATVHVITPFAKSPPLTVIPTSYLTNKLEAHYDSSSKPTDDDHDLYSTVYHGNSSPDEW